MAVTWNPSDKSTNITLSAGDLTAQQTGTNTWNGTVRATLGKSTGKWYWEVLVVNLNPDNVFCGGISNTSAAVTNYCGSNTNSWGYYFDGTKYTNGSSVAYGSSYGVNAVIGVALDMDNGKVWFAEDNLWQASGDPAAGTNAAYTGLTGTLYPTISLFRNNSQATGRFKPGNQTYAPPSGFSAIDPGDPYVTAYPNNRFFLGM